MKDEVVFLNKLFKQLELITNLSVLYVIASSVVGVS